MRKYLYGILTDQVQGKRAFVLKSGLWVFSLLYGLIVRIIPQLYSIGVFHVQKLPRPVISVGNITMGGVGKTPLVIRIADLVKARGKLPVILMRGYNGGDEVDMIKEILPDVPVVSNPDRYQAALAFLKEGKADVFILDDGFQHWKLHRDLDIVCVDASHPCGNGHCLPRGIMREPLDSLKRADIVMLTKVSREQENSQGPLRSINRICRAKSIELVGSNYKSQSLVNILTKEKVDVDYLKGKPVCSVCAIGNPDSFYASIEQLGVLKQEPVTFIDHHQYMAVDVKRIVEHCRNMGCTILVTTHKDAVKLKPLLVEFKNVLSFYYLEGELILSHGRESFIKRIHSLLYS